MRPNIYDFLHKYHMHYDTIDMDSERERLVESMKDGLSGRPSSLMMIPSFITVDGAFSMEKEVLVMDAGGTNFRIATAGKREDGSIRLSHFRRYPMPGTKGRISIDAFFESLAGHIEEILKVADIDSAGFCFSYVADILPNGEGRLHGFYKEVEIEGAGGQLIGEGINRVLSSRGRKPLRFVLLNDTVATLLSGMLRAQQEYAGYIGYILGTGTNACYLERCENIVKNEAAAVRSGRMAVNMESGIYTGFELGEFDAELDRESQNPGDHLMEKMMGGVYQGTVIYKTVKRAAEEGLFSSVFSERLGTFNQFTMMQIGEFCAEPAGGGELSYLCGENPEDRQGLYEIIDASFERAGRMAATLFAATIQQAGYESTAERPVCITVEGTSFTKSVLFRLKLDRYIKEYLNESLRYYCHIVSIEDATLIGSACAALL